MRIVRLERSRCCRINEERQGDEEEESIQNAILAQLFVTFKAVCAHTELLVAYFMPCRLVPLRNIFWVQWLRRMSNPFLLRVAPDNCHLLITTIERRLKES